MLILVDISTHCPDTYIKTLHTVFIQMQYPTLIHSTEVVGIARLPEIYPGADPITGIMSRDYYRFHKTWAQSDDYQSQTMGLHEICVKWLPAEHDFRMQIYATNSDLDAEGNVLHSSTGAESI